jgi:hypothetical protein
MLTRYTNMSVKSQSYLFTFGLLITLLGMALTDMWMPMVVGAIVLTGLVVESWIRVVHVIPLHNELRQVQRHLDAIEKKLNATD